MGESSRENESARGQIKKSGRKPATTETEEKSRVDLVERNWWQQNSVTKIEDLTWPVTP
jgi:phage repressor protein C with HTH and peptisase S24 domain